MNQQKAIKENRREASLIRNLHSIIEWQTFYMAVKKNNKCFIQFSIPVKKTFRALNDEKKE